MNRARDPIPGQGLGQGGRATDDGGLVRMEEDGSARRWTAVQLLVAGAFLACTAGAGLSDLIAPARARRPRGEELARDRRWRASARITDGTRMAVVDRDLELRSNLRQLLLPAYGAVLLRWFGEVHEKLVLGEQGWLFARDRLDPGELTDQETASFNARLLAAIDRRLALRGVKLVVVPVPRKGVVCRRYLPAGLDPRPGLEEALVRSLRRLGVTTVNLMAAFEGHPAADLYHRWDIHWTATGQRLAAEATCREAGILVPAEVRTTRLADAGWQDARRGLLQYGGIDPGAFGVRALLPVDRVRQLQPVMPDGAPPDWGDPPDTPRIVLLGTSFSAGPFVPYLRHFSDQSIGNESRGGFTALSNLIRFAWEKRGEMPELLFFEIPVDQAFLPVTGDGWVSFAPNRSEFFLGGEVSRMSVLLPADRVPVERSGRGARQRILAQVPGGQLAASADGACSLRIRGEMVGGEVQVVLRYRGVVSTARWARGRHEMSLPLISSAAVVGALTVSLKGSGVEGFRLDGIEVVTEYDLAAGVPARPGPVSSGGEGWSQSFSFDGALETGDHAAVWLELEPGGDRGGELWIELLPAGEGDPARTLGPIPVEAGTIVLHSLEAPRRGLWRGLRVHGGPDSSVPGMDVRVVSLPEGTPR